MAEVQKILPELMTPEEVAAAIRRSTATLARDRMYDRGIPYVKYSRKVFYRRVDVMAFINSRLVGGKKQYFHP